MPRALRRLKTSLKKAVQHHAHLDEEQLRLLRTHVDLLRGEITISWPTPGPDLEEQVEELAQGALQAVHQRVLTGASKDALREQGNQLVPAAVVHQAWVTATEAVPVHTVPKMDAAYVSLLDRLQQLVNTCEEERFIQLPPSSKGVPRIAVRLGVDGTIPQWKQPVELVALNVHDGHEADKWVPVGHFLGHESRDTLRTFIAGAHWDQQLTRSGCLPFKSATGVDMEAMVFICGDHMAMCRLGSADQPSSYLDDRRICPCCDTIPDDIFKCA